jgi:serine/threonine-protein kinase HipA
MRQLNVFWNNVKAGVLTELQPGRGYIFCYDESYLASDLPAIAIRLPKRKEPYESEYLFSNFANMLPEGGNRRVICRSLHIDETDYFGLLMAMADKDFIGAVEVRKITNDGNN